MVITQLPPIGMGTWQMKGDKCERAVHEAITLGYRLIDTAQIYGNETEIGRAIKNASIPREDLCIATKIWITNLNPKRILSSLTKSLQKLLTNYIDILYVHWPALGYNPKKSLPIFDKLLDQGTIKHIGASNFTIAHLREAQSVLQNKLEINQVEFHPFLRQTNLRDYMEINDIKLVAYAPLARGLVLQDSTVKRIAQAHQKSSSQVVLAWIMNKNAIPIPKSSKKEHLRANLESVSLLLSPEEINQIDGIVRQQRQYNIPIIHPKWDD